MVTMAVVFQILVIDPDESLDLTNVNRRTGCTTSHYKMHGKNETL